MSGLLDSLQGVLTYDGCTGKQFVGNGLGKIGTTGFLLGIVGGVHYGILLTLFLVLDSSNSNYNSPFIKALTMWSTYMALLCTFHFMEFFTTAVHQPTVLAYESYIVNHSKSYTIAAIASWTEFWVEYYFFRGNKLYYSVFVVGVLLVLLGQVVRSVAMWHCGEHFSHIIMHEKKAEHRLVTSGIYKYLRHPSYFGWFYWSVGTQLVLCNPICTIAYAAAAWHFFNTRIPYEEDLLVRFYGDQYTRYARSTIVGIPAISTAI